MEKITLTDIEKYTGGKRSGSALITSISIDSRSIPSECLFVGIKGENFDGNDFVEQAVENHAAAVLTTKQIYNASSVVVNDTNQAFLDLALAYKAKFKDLKSIAVTGSVGKTTTKEMIYSILSKMGKSLKNEGNFNNHIGVPLTVFNLNKFHQYAVFELGMSHRHEIKPLSLVVKPQVSVITNISMSHIEFLGSREEIAKEKLDILAGTSESIVLCGDEPLLRDIKTDKHIIYFGLVNPDVDYKATNIEVIDDATEFSVLINGRKVKVKINAIGEHNVLNALAAIASTASIGATEDEIIAGLLEFKNADMRQNIYTYNGYKIIEDCYNASSPDAMKASIDSLCLLDETNKIAVLGQMGELGDFTTDAHKEVLEYAKSKLCNIYLYGEFWSKQDLSDVKYFEQKEELVADLKNMLNADTAVLIKGSRFTKMEEIIKLIKE